MTQNKNTKGRVHSPGERGLFAAPKQDFLASIVVFLVALPLCMGIAIASGVPVAAGLITGIVGGLVVGWIAGAPLQVSGPAAGLTVIVFDLVRHHGLEVLGLAVMLGGALQLVAGLMRYGRWFRAVSPAVVHGMLAGIGVLILSSQFHVMVDDEPKGSGVQNLVSIPNAIRNGLPIPELGTVEARTARRNLLQQFGALHEQQIQLRELAAEKIPASRKGPGHAPAAEKPVMLGLPTTRQLELLVTRQQSLVDRCALLVEQLDQPLVSENVRNPDRLEIAKKLMSSKMLVALDDLQAGRLEQIRGSQSEVQQSLELVLSELKNHDWAAKIGLLTILVLVLWKFGAPAKWQFIPAPLVAILIATIVTAILKLPVLYVEVPDNLLHEIHIPTLATLRSVPLAALMQAGVVLAVVASAETLLCATAVDQIQTATRTNYDKELAAQGVGNMVCGLLGALPMTGVIVRSSANVEAGARTRLSTILHGVWLLVFVALLAFLLRMIPTAALAAMLVYIGYKLIDFKAIGELRRYGWGEVVIYVATLGTIVCTDLLTGVITGVALSAIKLLHNFSHLDVQLEVDQASRRAVLHLNGAATFVRLPLLAASLERVPGDVELHVELAQLGHIDHACLDLLMNWGKQHEGTGGTLVIDWESLQAYFQSGPDAAEKPS